MHLGRFVHRAAARVRRAIRTLIDSVRRARIGRVCGPIAHARYRSLQVRFRVDQELAGDDDGVAGLDTFEDLGLPATLDAGLDVDRRKAAVALREDDDSALARPNHSFARDE